MKNFQNLVSTFVILLVGISLSQAFIQELILHESETEDGNFYSFRSQVPKVDGVYNFSNVKRVCARGSWIVYRSENFFNYTESGFGACNTDRLSCVNTTFPYKSFRHIAAGNNDKQALSLYLTEDKGKWSGTEIFITASAYAGIQEEVPYFGMSGKDTEWLLFEGQNFNGNYSCYRNAGCYAQGYTVGVSVRNISTIGSVFKGCDFETFKRFNATRNIIYNLK